MHNDTETSMRIVVIMDKIKNSILQQKAHGTWDRNQYIRYLYKTVGNMAEVGRQFHLTRQAIRKIVTRGNDGRSA